MALAQWKKGTHKLRGYLLLPNNTSSPSANAGTTDRG